MEDPAGEPEDREAVMFLLRDATDHRTQLSVTSDLRCLAGALLCRLQFDQVSDWL